MKALGVLGFFFQIGKRDEQREIRVLMAGRFEFPIELLLDQFPNAIAPRLDDHASTGL